MGTPLSSWKAQEQAALSIRITSFMGRLSILRSFTKQPSWEMKQCSLQSLCWMRSFQGSRQSRISFAQQEWLAVKIITSYLSFKLLSSSTAPGRMLMPASACSPVGNLIVILRSCQSWMLSLQWMRVSSRSNTTVFFPSNPARRSNCRIFDLICYFVGIFEFSSVFRICIEVVRCSLTADLPSLQCFTTYERQQLWLRGEQGFCIKTCADAPSGTCVTNPCRESFRYLGGSSDLLSSSCWESLRIWALRRCKSSCLRAVFLLCEKTLREFILRSKFSILLRTAVDSASCSAVYSISIECLYYRHSNSSDKRNQSVFRQRSRYKPFWSTSNLRLRMHSSRLRRAQQQSMQYFWAVKLRLRQLDSCDGSLAVTLVQCCSICYLVYPNDAFLSLASSSSTLNPRQR